MIEFQFAQPEALLLVALLPLLLLAGLRSAPPRLTYSDVRLAETAPLSWRVRWRRLPDVLRVLAWLTLVILAARPQTGRVEQRVTGEGIDIVLAIDVSSSMSARDFGEQNRLEAAKAVIDGFIAGRVSDRIGLVIFAENAFHLVPPTLDYAILRGILNNVQLATDLEIEDGTAIGTGLLSAASMLRSSDTTSKVIILLTDGENTAGQIDPLTAAAAVEVLGYRIYTIGMVNIEALTQTGEANVDERMLEALASQGGGAYFRAEDFDGLRAIYEQIDALERTTFEQTRTVDWSDHPEVWLILAIELLLVERMLRYTVFRTAL
jgi:Ca-activated chloride channel family protein